MNTKKTTKKIQGKPITAQKNPYLCGPEKAWIRFAIQCIEEQIELLSQGMANENNAEGYLGQSDIDQAIEVRQLNLANLRTMLGD